MVYVIYSCSFKSVIGHSDIMYKLTVFSAWFMIFSSSYFADITVVLSSGKGVYHGWSVYTVVHLSFITVIAIPFFSILIISKTISFLTIQVLFCNNE